MTIDDLPTVLRTSLQQLDSRLQADPDAEQRETWQAAVTAMEAAHAVFAAATATSDVDVRVGDRVLTLAPGSSTDLATAETWLTAGYLAMICRESSVLETLMNTHITGSPEVDALQSYLRRGRIAKKNSDDATIKALSRFLGGQPGLFAEALARALEPDRVALGPLAVACAAFDRRFPIGVESVRLPKNLVERRWRTERPVPPPASGRRTWRIVDRHEVDPDLAEREGDALTAQLIGHDPTELHVIGPKALQETGYHLINDREGSWIHTWDSLTLAMQAYHGIFAAATTPRAEVVVRLRDEKVLIPATGATPHTNADTWLQAMYLSMLCRDGHRIDDLVRVPQELRRSDDDAVNEWVGVLHGYWYGGYSMSERSLEAVPPDDDLLYPTVDLFYQISRDHQDGFTESLARALERHRRYWTQTEERALDPSGFFALAPLALAARAQQSGWLKVTVRSPYLPLILLDGERVGEGGPR